MRALSGEQPPLALEDLDEIIGDRAHPRHFREIAPDQQPDITFRQPVAERDFHEIGFVRRHDISGQQRDAVVGARGGGLRGLAAGAE
jgi:hypothetical protein